MHIVDVKHGGWKRLQLLYNTTDITLNIGSTSCESLFCHNTTTVHFNACGEPVWENSLMRDFSQF